MAYLNPPNVCHMDFSHTWDSSDIKLLPIQDQGKSDACLHIQAAELAGVIFAKLHGTEHIKLSALNLMERVRQKYSSAYSDDSCWVYLEHQIGYLRDEGISADEDYPNEPARKFKLKDFTTWKNSPADEDTVLQHLQQHPMIGFFAAGREFEYQRPGQVYRGPSISEPTSEIDDHAVLITGFGSVEQEGELIKAYEVKNSYGYQWGNKGYGFVDRSIVGGFIEFNNVVAEPPF